MSNPITMPAPRSILFVPANRLDLTAKVHRSGADAVCFDSEDAIPMNAKACVTVSGLLSAPLMSSIK